MVTRVFTDMLHTKITKTKAITLLGYWTHKENSHKHHAGIFQRQTTDMDTTP
jgi:hypothetical protein